MKMGRGSWDEPLRAGSLSIGVNGEPGAEAEELPADCSGMNNGMLICGGLAYGYSALDRRFRCMASGRQAR